MQEVCIGPLDAIPVGGGKAFTVSERSVAVFRPSAGGLFAAQNSCPHAAGPLASGMVGANSVICPLHYWKFDLETGACVNDPSYRIRLYKVREENGEVYVAVEE